MPDDGNPVECPQCGGYALHYRCSMCGGEGEFNLFDDNPNEYEPGDVETCEVCKGDGEWTICSECDYDSGKKSQ